MNDGNLRTMSIKKADLIELFQEWFFLLYNYAHSQFRLNNY
jgi:hypothetical protein